MNALFKKHFLVEFQEEYCTGVFSDELDNMGYKNQVSTRWKLNNSHSRVFGKIRTMKLETIITEDERINKGLSFLANLNSNDVFLVKGSQEYAYYGELMTRLSMEREISGTIIDGLTRDTYFTQKEDFPIFAKGYSPVDIKGRGRVGEVDTPVEIDGILVKPGDYVFGDNDALVFLPQKIFEDLVKNVNTAVKEEADIKQKIRKGISVKEILLTHKSF